jgi:Tfp pilus assembly protein PilN
MQKIKNMVRRAGQFLVRNDKCVYTGCAVTAIFIGYLLVGEITHGKEIIERDQTIKQLLSDKQELLDIDQAQYQLLQHQHNIMEKQRHQLQDAETVIRKMMERIKQLQIPFDPNRII